MMWCVCVGGGGGGGGGGELGLCTLVLCIKPSTKPSGPMGIANDPAIFNDSLHISRFLGADLNIIDRKRLRCLHDVCAATVTRGQCYMDPISGSWFFHRNVQDGTCYGLF